jgi:DNA (cytosine-5)-methyltransferase 1
MTTRTFETVRTRGERVRLAPARPRATRLTTKPVVHDLFAGAGLFSGALAAEGFHIACAIELNGTAAETYAANVGDHLLVGDVRSFVPEGRCDVLIAGPPCQGFSTLGHRDSNDPRNRLSLEIVRWAEVTLPQIIVVENVAAFAKSPHHGELVRRLERLNYETTTLILNAVDFGVAQLRERSFTFASLGALPFVRPTPSQRRTVAEALSGLSVNPDGKNNHYSPEPRGMALERIKVIPPGGDKRDVMRLRPDLVPPSWVPLGSNVTDAWGRMEWDHPATTLRTCFNNPSKGRYLHPLQDRVISLREGARIHSIADTFSFAGWPIDIAMQIGNSVPPNLGRAIARAVMRELR